MPSSFSLLSPALRAAIRDLGYSENNEIQEAAIPVVASGKNVLILAPTGSGKTEAAIFPLFDALLKDPEGRIMYVTPLRSLNRDIELRLKKLGKSLGLSVALRHGDTSSWEKTKINRSPPNLIVTTPESLEGLLISPSLANFLKKIRAVVIDEAQELTNSKRGIAFSYALERLVGMKGEFQRVGLSAFTSDYGSVARGIFGNRQFDVVQIKGFRPVDINVQLVPKDEEIYSIKNIADRSSSVLVFTNTRETAEWLGKKLSYVTDVGVHHGSLSKEVRENLEVEFRSGSKKILVCTSSLELGIDVGRIDTVIQYYSPRRVETLLQRIGRAGHRQGGVAKGYIITNNALDYLESLVIARRASQRLTERYPDPPLGLDVLAHEMVGLLLDRGRLKLEDLQTAFSRSFYFKADEVAIEGILQALQRLRVIRVRDGIITKTIFTRKYYALHVSMIPNKSEFFIRESSSIKELGKLDYEFVIAHCQPGALVRLAGRDWRVESVDTEKMEVWFSATAASGLVPSWEGELIPVESEIANEVASSNIFSSDLKQLTDAGSLVKLQEDLRSNPLPGYALVFSGLPANGQFGLFISSPLGSRTNMAFGIALSRFLEERGFSTSFFRDQYKLVFETGLPIGDDIIKEFFGLDDEKIKLLYVNGLLSSPLYLSRLLRVCLRLGLINSSIVPGQPLLRKIADAWSNTWVEKEVISEIASEDADLKSFLFFLSEIRDGKLPLIFGSEYKNAFFVEKRGNDLLTAMDTINNRLLTTPMKLICLSCGWENVYKVSELPEKITCPRCGSMMVACTSPYSDTQNLVKKVRTGKKLSPDEKKLAGELMKSSNLVSQYGRYAAYVLAGRGIGPETAVRILLSGSKLTWPPTEIIRKIAKAEAEFNRTHMFWHT